jgi:hypothetical protein
VCTLTWPGHDGIATNITMLPGDLVLYESHSVLHGVSCIEIEGGHDWLFLPGFLRLSH